MFTNIPFKVNYPLSIFENKEINFKDKKEREKLFERNIYYNLFERERNTLLEKNHELYYAIGKEVLGYINRNHKNLNILNLSLFGSSTVLENPGDYDFLVITDGDIALLEEPELNLNNKKVQTGISIKGIENYINGFKRKDKDNSNKRLEQIIDRTVVSLYRRHIPLFGSDFVNNEKEFLDNAYAQVSDLVNNAYELFYLIREDKFVPIPVRAKKLLTRCYEAASYLGIIDSDEKIEKMRKKVYFALKDRYDLEKSKRIFDEFSKLYEEKI
jgi:hypothetical protein